MRRTYEPRDIERIESSITTDVLRDWRRHGFLDGTGEQQPNGRWIYSAGDVMRLVCARWFERNGIARNIAGAIDLASPVVPIVYDYIAGVQPMGGYRYIVAVGNTGGLMSFGARKLSELGKLERSHSILMTAAIIVDCEKLAREIRPILGGVVADLERSWK